MDTRCTSTPKPIRNSKRPQSPSSDSVQPTTTKCPSFPQVNLFSLSAVLSHSHHVGYNFIFLHEGRRQQAVLQKTFVTGLEKDNVKITWEEARRELTLGCEIRIDVTQFKSSSVEENWLVFGLYFNSKFCADESYWNKSAENSFCEKVVGRSYQTASSLLHIDNYQTGQKYRVTKLDGEDVNEDEFVDGGNTFDFKEVSPIRTIVQADDPSICKDNYSEVDSKDSLDESLSVSFGSVNESGDSSDDFSLLVNPDLSTNHMEDISITEDLQSLVKLPDEGIYFESLFWRSGSLASDTIIDAQFENVMADNGLLVNYKDLSSAFDQIFEDTFKLNFMIKECLVHYSADYSVICNSTSSLDPEGVPSSSVVFDSSVSKMSQPPLSQVTEENIDCEGTDCEVSVHVGPSLASTPSERFSDGDFSLSLCSGLVSDGNFNPVKMDSGFYERLSSASFEHTCVESDETSKLVKNDLDKFSGKGRDDVFYQFLYFSFSQILTELVSII